MNNFRLTILCCVLVFIISGCQTTGKKMYYMHGSDLFGKDANSKQMQRYNRIVEYLGEYGFDVVFEAKEYADLEGHSTAIAQAVKSKIASGVKPENIVVGGFSYGSMTSLLAAGKISNPKVNYVLLAGCPDSPSIDADIEYDLVKGRILSIVDVDDHKFSSCKDRLPSEGVILKEIEIDSGKGHKVFKLNKKKWMDYWVDPFVQWVNQV